MMFMSACVVTTQIVVVLIASWSGRKAGVWGRKPLLLIAFAVLPIRGLLYTLTDNPTLLVAIQILDGVGRGVVRRRFSPGHCRPDAGHGSIQPDLGRDHDAVGIGASLSQVIAGGIVHHFGYPAGFIFLAAVASLAFGILYFFMPETGSKR